MSKWRKFHEEVADELEDLRIQLDSKREDQTMMVQCIKMGHVRRLQRLIDRGVNANFAGKHGDSPLHVAAGLPPTPKSEEILQLLVFVGAPLERRNRFGLSPLHIASKVSAKTVNLFLDAGASIDSQDNAGRTSLMLACECAAPDTLVIVKSLLDRGANPLIKDEDGQTAMDYTIINREPDVILRSEVIYTLFYAGCVLNAQTRIECSPIMEEIGRFIASFNRNELNLDDPHLFDVLKALVRGGALGENLWNYLPIYSMLIVECSDIYKKVFELFEPLTSASGVKRLANLLRVTQEQMECEGLKSFIELLRQSSRTVRPLKCASRNVVRRELRGKIFPNVGKLNLPKPLESYLTYSECL